MIKFLKEKGWKSTLDFWKAAGWRALRTFAQTASGFFTVGALLKDIDWVVVLSASAVSAIYSILMSIVTGLPEAPVEKDEITDAEIEKLTK